MCSRLFEKLCKHYLAEYLVCGDSCVSYCADWNRNYVEGGLLKIENRIKNTVSSMRKYHNFFCLFYSCDFSFRNKSAVISTIMKNNSESRSLCGEFINFEIIEQGTIYY